MEAGGDSSSTLVTESIRRGDPHERIEAEDDAEAKHVWDEVHGNQKESVDNKTGDAEDDVKRRDVMLSEEAGDEDGLQDSEMQGREDEDDVSRSEKNVPLETVTSGIIAPHQMEAGSDSEAAPPCNPEVDHHEMIPNGQDDTSQQACLTDATLCSQPGHESVDSRTTELQTHTPAKTDGRPCHQSKTQARSEDVSIADAAFDVGATTAISHNTLISTSSPHTVADCSSPEAFLLSISKIVSETSQKVKSPKKRELHEKRTSASSQSNHIKNIVRPEEARTGHQAEIGLISRTEFISSAGDDDQDDDLLSELDAELDEFLGPQNLTEVDPINGLLKKGLSLEEFPQFKLMRAQSQELQRNVDGLHGEITSLQERLSSQQQQVTELVQEKESLQLQMRKAGSVQAVHLLRMKELELLIDQQKVELSAGKERQLSHDAVAKKAITKLQQEMILRVDQVKSMYEEAIKEKEAIVIKYAKSEKEVLDQKKLREAVEKSHKELNQTVESLKTQLHDTKKDRSKLKHAAASKETEASYMQKEIDQLKEEGSSQGIKVKWAQNKLKTELDSHKDTKVKLAKTEQRLTEAKEETEQIRKNCQEMIKTYQTSEEVKSNSLDKQLKVKHSELEQKLQEQREHLEVHQARLRELDSLKKKLADNMAELDSLKVKSKCLEDERLQNEKLLAKFKELLNSQKEENRRLNRQLEEKKTLTQELENLKQTEIKLRLEVSGQKVDQSDLETELESSRQKETELLHFTEKITSKNTNLSSENAALLSKTSHLESLVHNLQREQNDLKTSYSQLSMELKQEHEFREQESSLLTTKLNEKSRAIEQLSIQLDEARDDNKTLKRKHVANTKDLTRQLQQAHKRLESLDSNDNHPRDNISVGSRTSSSGSLDTLPGSNPSAINSSGSSVSVSTPATSKHEEHSAPQDHTVAIATGNDYPGVDKGMLVDRIVRLQKAHQRKNEKMEFMQEHMTHLVDELKKKSRIIQQYVMRDEAGALVPVSSDINKPPSSLRNTMAQMSKQGGIMSSLYRSQATDPTMTLDLSLEINRKLQAVLEDTLLKNIFLKENLETLGQEIARLLKEQQNKTKLHPSLSSLRQPHRSIKHASDDASDNLT